MGAEAITTLSSTTLIRLASQWSLLKDILPFLKGTTLLFWAIGTWWIPFLILLGVWRYLVRRFPLRYEAGYWAMVFPLGMYTVCTHELSQIIAVPLLGIIPCFAF
jgi:tellurite resistance protein TehA-like permease